ncbi:GTP-binding protein [Endozoicomonas sp. OPT23]|uniref:YdcH family protein n=1 Tax=Endozoicomonas sp. OPT23 TaxID=2072845 RepID=UPI00129A27AE|nr:DUF465 domain-containing protein [Endozoicomonas sp. OPT23]MRI35029.1 GTP-binding protein [Endozoicomonas sp. OPT23]
MLTEHHDLLHELPQYKDQIHDLKINDRHFRRLFDAYHDLTRDIENMESEVTPVTSHVEEEYKLRRVRLKDELHRMLQSVS